MRHSIKRSNDRKYNIDLHNKTCIICNLRKDFLQYCIRTLYFWIKHCFPIKFNVCAGSTYLGYLPMLRVTVMMFRDIVESVMLLNEEDWRQKQEKERKMISELKLYLNV